jgi:hypothetical protein
VDEVTSRIKDISAHPEFLIEKRENCRKLSHPDAALKIAALAMEISYPLTPPSPSRGEDKGGGA